MQSQIVGLERPRRLLAATSNSIVPSTGSQPQAHEASKKPKRKVIYNACDGCRKTKVKCSGTQPCLRCERDNKVCVFAGRAHERAQRELLTSEHNLASARHELRNSQQDLEDSRQDNHRLHHDLLKAQADLLEYQASAQTQQLSMANIFDLLRAPRQYEGANLMDIARGSQNVGEFLQHLYKLPPEIRQELDLTKVLGVMTPNSIMSPTSTTSAKWSTDMTPTSLEPMVNGFGAGPSLDQFGQYDHQGLMNERQGTWPQFAGARPAGETQLHFDQHDMDAASSFMSQQWSTRSG